MMFFCQHNFFATLLQKTKTTLLSALCLLIRTTSALFCFHKPCFSINCRFSYSRPSHSGLPLSNRIFSSFQTQKNRNCKQLRLFYTIFFLKNYSAETADSGGTKSGRVPVAFLRFNLLTNLIERWASHFFLPSSIWKICL